jgi:chromosome partitioning protein
MIVSIFNQAGGVAKTTLTQNLGYHLSQREKRVLLVDLDPQASLTAFMGLVGDDLEETLYHALVQEKPLPIHTNINGVDLVPSNILLSGAEIELSAEIARETRLKTALLEVSDLYDFILIDCPPSLGLLSIIALVASSHLLIPIHCHYKALIGTDQLLATVAKVRRKINPALKIAGVVPTMFDRRASQDARMLETIEKQLSPLGIVFPSIPRAVAFADASEEHLPLALYKSSHPAVPILDKIAKTLIEMT